MRGKVIIGWFSVALLVLATGFVAYGVWFCAGALHGNFEGCLASAGTSALASPYVFGAFILGVAGLIFARARPRQ